MKNFKFLILLLVVVAGISFAAGRNNRAERAKRGKGNSYIIDVQRNKGLGELTPEQVIDTILTPETRRITQYQMDDFDEFYEMLDKLMGSDPSGRRRLVMSEGA